MQTIQDSYPDELQQDIIDTITEHICLGILKGGIDEEEAQPLQFSDIAKMNLKSRGMLAVAYYLDLESVLNSGNKRMGAAGMRDMLQLSPNASLNKFIAQNFYYPLLDRLAN